MTYESGLIKKIYGGRHANCKQNQKQEQGHLNHTIFKYDLLEPKPPWMESALTVKAGEGSCVPKRRIDGAANKFSRLFKEPLPRPIQEVWEPTDKGVA